MKRICIGIHVSEQPDQLRATLNCLRRNTGVAHRLILLPDGPDPETRLALQSFTDIPQFGSEQAQGAAACFNRLAANTDEEFIVLVENGVRVAPSWLARMLAALATDASYGLCGPSTNLAWNEQGVFPAGGPAEGDLTITASEARQRFGDEVRTLEPLHSLSDFCYLVRREVIETVGAADEAYGLGPCWEMDYNVRAARAGWRGAWVCGSYVYRAPFTIRRRLEETRRFEISKHLYQDRFCGARLRGEKSDYRMHCRGNACSNFAPTAQIRIHKPLPTEWSRALRQAVPTVAEQRGPISSADVFSQTALPALTEPEGPLVSCIMPTRDRRPYLAHSIRCFLRQDYRNSELLIVDDGVDQVRDCVPEDRRIRYLRLDGKLSLGAKRNFACEHARGEIIVHWDDDDWYPPGRVRTQANALLTNGADLCGNRRVLYYNPNSDQAWEYRYDAPGPAWVGGNTLAYRKSFWQRNRFPDVQVAEDSLFIWSTARKSVLDLEPTLCIAMVHVGNTSPKETGGSFWHPQPSDRIRALLGDERYLYCAPNHGTWPLVSCIMPTYNRRAFVRRALAQFAAQDYPNRELIVVDDGTVDIEDLTRDLPNVQYLRPGTRSSIGAKRNLACQHASGAIIAHWDDDDWYSPDRLRYQAMPILMDQTDITGLENGFVLQLPEGEFWTMKPALHGRMFVGDVHGGTLVYRRELFTEGLRYPEINLAEDAALLQTARNRGYRLLRLSNPGVFVYVRHGVNAWKEFVPGRFIDPGGWERSTPPPTFGIGNLESYRAAAESLHGGPLRPVGGPGKVAA